jgi:lysophospholipase L1-like esterase
VLLMGRARLLPFTDDFARADGELGNGWTGATWAIVSGVAGNTPTVGAEVIVNGGFVADTDWGKSAGWTISDGALHCTVAAGAYSQGYQNSAVTVKQWYALTFDLANLTGGSIFVQEGATTIRTIAANGTHTIVFCSQEGGALRFKADSAGMTADFDNVSLKAITPATLFASRSLAADGTYSLQVPTMPEVATKFSAPAGIVVNLDSVSNPQNYVLVHHNNTSVVLAKVVNGTYSAVQTTSKTFAGGSLMLVKSGETYSIYYDSVLVGTAKTISDATIVNNTLGGIVSGHTGITLDEYTASAKTTLKRFGIIGDSIPAVTSGNGIWPFLVARRNNEGACSIANHAAGNMGVLVGASNLAAQVTASASDNADIIIMALGTNDDNAGNMATLQAAVESGIDTLRGTNAAATVYYMNVLPRTSGDKALVRAAIAAACAAKSVTCWDTVTDAWIDPATDTSDGLHPTAAGYVKIRDRILARI